MTQYYLVRHGDTDYSPTANWNTPGWGADLSPLTETGVQQIHDIVPRLEELQADILLSSPMTRALQGAAILHSKLNIPMQVEFDLHEWVPDTSFQWKTLEDVLKQLSDLDSHNGEWPPELPMRWEPLSAVRSRVEKVLERYSQHKRVIVMCHGIVIRSLTGKNFVKNCEVVPFSLSAG